MNARGLMLAGAVILLTNAVVLLGVARNRSGAAVESIQLTERELPQESRGKEDTGVSLRFQWERYNAAFFQPYAWLDQAKLEALGFDCRAALRDPKHPPLPRPAFLVLEYNGPAWEQWLRAAEQETPSRPFVSSMNSRLFVIDAAKTPEPLLARYADRQRYLIVRGVVRVVINDWDPIRKTAGPPQLQAAVPNLLPGTVHVPPPLSNALASLATDPHAGAPRYTVTLSYGRRFEPWIVTQP